MNPKRPSSRAGTAGGRSVRTETLQNPKPAPDTVGVWVRVSNTEQTTENQALALQQEVTRRHLTVVKEYRLDGYSAWSGEHSGRLEEMLGDAEAGLFASVAVWALDRLSRQGELPLLTILDRLERAGVTIISLQESWAEGTSDFRGVLTAVSGFMARAESERRSERVKAGLRRAIAKDIWAFGQVPYGYRRGADGRLCLDEDEANVVVKIFALADAERVGAREIQKRLIGTVPTTRGGAAWAISVIDRLLRDTTYCGRHRSGITAPPIITQAQFDRVQARLLANRSLKPRTENYWPLQGRMRCHCGQSWTFDAARPGKNKVDTCFCRGRTTTSRRVILGGPRCSIPRQSEREVVKRLWLHLYESLGDRDHMLAALDASVRDIRAYVEEHSRDVAPMRAELERTTEKLKRIARERINGVLTDEEIDASEAEARSQKGELERKLADLDPRRVDIIKEGQRQLERAEWLQAALKAGELSGSGGAAHYGIYGPDLLTTGSDLHDLQGRWRRNFGKVLDRLHAEVIVFPDHMEVRGLLSFTVPLGDQWPPENWESNSRVHDGPVPPLHAFHAPVLTPEWAGVFPDLAGKGTRSTQLSYHLRYRLKDVVLPGGLSFVIKGENKNLHQPLWTVINTRTQPSGCEGSGKPSQDSISNAKVAKVTPAQPIRDAGAHPQAHTGAGARLAEPSQPSQPISEYGQTPSKPSQLATLEDGDAVRQAVSSARSPGSEEDPEPCPQHPLAEVRRIGIPPIARCVMCLRSRPASRQTCDEAPQGPTAPRSADSASGGRGQVDRGRPAAAFTTPGPTIGPAEAVMTSRRPR